MRLALFSGIGTLAISRKRLRHGDEAGMGFQPSWVLVSIFQGRCPWLGWHRLALFAPKAHHSTSLGQRPRFSVWLADGLKMQVLSNVA